MNKTSKHDKDTRWLAILYVNGEFFESGTHSGCLKQFFDKNDIEYDGNVYFRKDVSQQINENDLIQEYAFMHLVDEENAQMMEDEGIYIETDTIYGIDLNSLIAKVKSHYSQYEIYDDNNIIEKDTFTEKYKRLAKIATYDPKDEYDFVVVESPLYPQDYFEMRNPSRLKKLKELHDKNQYIPFEQLTQQTVLSGLAMDKVNRMPGDTVTVYHGCAAAFIDSILASGLTENFENSYQSHGVNYGLGIWVTLNYDGAQNYATHSARGWTRDNQDSTDENITQYFNYGAVIEMEVSKDTLNDEGSASNNNLKSNEIITPDKIKQIYVFDIKTGETWNWF